MTEHLAPQHEPVPHPLALRDFRYLWVARFASAIATSGLVVIVGYQLYDVGRGTDGLSIRQASMLLGLLGFVQFLPLMLATPFAGVVADRHDRRYVAGLALLFDGLVALALVVISTGHHGSLAALFAAGAAHGLARAFLRPPLSAMVSGIVPVESLPRAVALTSIAWQSGAVAGPALAGVLYAQAVWAPYALAVVLLLVASFAVMRIHAIPMVSASRDQHPLQQMTEGFRYVRSERLLFSFMTLDLFAVLLGGATALLPVYARDLLHVGASGLGVMRAAPALGAALVGLMLSLRPVEHKVGLRLLQAVAAYGLMTVIFGLSRWYPLSLLMLAGLGAADMISVYIRNTLMQLRTPDDKRGRVSAIAGLTISGSNELGEMESGLAAALLGPVGAVVLGGVAAIGITALWAGLFPELRRAQSFTQPPQARYTNR